MDQQSQKIKDIEISLAQLELAKESSLVIIRDCPDSIKIDLQYYFDILIEKLRASSSIG